MMTYIARAPRSAHFVSTHERTNGGEGGRERGRAGGRKGSEGRGAKDTNTDHSLNRCILFSVQGGREGLG